MTAHIAALLAHARNVPSPVRHEVARRLGERLEPGHVLLVTCHRVELYGPADSVRALAAEHGGVGELATDDAVARHVIALAVGRSSAVLAEDQVLHQLRTAVRTARERGPLPPPLEHLLDTSLRAGRRARSWLPAGPRPSLADAALDRLAPGASGTHPSAVLVVGAGQMGQLAARAVARRGLSLLVASRSTARATALARAVGGTVVPFDPGAAVAGVGGVVVALAGPWQVADATSAAIAASGVRLVDLSSPAAIPPALEAQLDGRLTTVDDLVDLPGSAPSSDLALRLDRLIESTLAEYRDWLERATSRTTARSLAARADAARDSELAALWERVPELDPAARAEVERMAERLAARLLRDPMERLRTDGDGRQSQAARELFGL